MLDQELCWEAVQRKDRSQDGRFVFGVVTTGVYCRPSCPSRTALRKNVRFYDSPAAAEQAGLRPCRRCHPQADGDPARAWVEVLCDYIKHHAGEPVTLEDLGREAGLSRFHLQRSFKAVVGLTPMQYVEACRLEALKGGLRSGGSVTDAVYDAGFGSSSRVYERADTRLGMTPAQYRAGGEGVSISSVSVETPVGLMTVAATDRGLCFVQFGDSRQEMSERLRREYPAAAIQELSPPYPEQLRLWIEALSRHLAGEQPHLELPVDVRATAYQMKVWRYLQSIPYGEVQSYAEVAAALGNPKGARAVARACASNRVAVAIPCHRVIRGTGELGGYRWGIERKRALIDRERAARVGGSPEPHSARKIADESVSRQALADRRSL